MEDCYTYTCDPATGKLTRRDCPGMCRPADYYLTSARFADSKTGITVDLKAPALPGTYLCSQIFDAATMPQLGNAALCTVSSTNDTGTLTIALGPGATAAVHSTLRLSSETALVSISNTSRRFRDDVTVELCSSCSKPQAVVVGPATAAPPCDAGGSGTVDLRLDGRGSRDASGRPLKGASWTLLGAEGLVGAQATAILDAITTANSKSSLR